MLSTKYLRHNGISILSSYLYLPLLFKHGDLETSFWEDLGVTTTAANCQQSPALSREPKQQHKQELHWVKPNVTL